MKLGIINDYASTCVSRYGEAMPKGDNKVDDNWYVFFVKSGQEVKASEEIKAYFKNNIQTRVFFTEILYKKNGIVKREKHIVFGGYVFALSRLDNEMFIIKCRNLISRSAVIYKILCYGDTGQAVLYEKDVQLLKRLWSERDSIDISVGIMEGDRIRIIEGPFIGKESMVRRINRHKRQAVIEIAFMGESRLITVGLDIIRKDNNG